MFTRGAVLEFTVVVLEHTLLFVCNPQEEDVRLEELQNVTHLLTSEPHVPGYGSVSKAPRPSRCL